MGSKVDPPRTLWGWGGWAQFLNNWTSTVPEHTIDKPSETQRNTELCCPSLGVVCVCVCVCVSVCVCVRVSKYPLWSYTFAFLQTQWQALTYQLVQCTCTSISQQCRMHAHTLQTLTLNHPHPHAPHTHTQTYTHTHTHIDACTDSTHWLFLFSQLCSDIKQSPLRENKHADEERLAGHRGRQYTHTYTHTHKHTQINVCTGSAQKLNDCQWLQQITKDYMAWPYSRAVTTELQIETKNHE